MAFLIVFAAALCACYSPEIRDCALACASPDDCAGGQTCGTDHLCAAPDTRCGADAGADPDAAHASPPDAAQLPPDAPAYILIHVHVDGTGSVTVSPCDTSCTCNTQLGPPDCMLHAISGVQSSAVAAGLGNQVFTMWNGPPCQGQPATCTFAPTPATVISVKFQKPS